MLGKKVEYSLQKGLENESCTNMILESIKVHKSLTRKEIEKLVAGVLSSNMTETQKRNRIDYILKQMRETGLIVNEKRGQISLWKLNQ